MSTSLPVRLRVLVLALGSILAATLLASVGLGATLPASAGADATIALPPVYSTAPGLPDGRVYEQVSPTNKHGNEAGAGTNQYLGAKEHYALAAGDGNSVLFEGTGAMGETTAAYSTYFVAHRSAAGWLTRSVQPRPQQSDAELGEGTLDQLQPSYLDMSPDFSHVMFEARHGSFAPGVYTQCGEFAHYDENQLYVGRSEPAGLDTWLARPEIPNPLDACGSYGESGAPAGGTPNFSSVYFAYPGTLLPEDASRASHAHAPAGYRPGEDVEAWGFYEDREGVLREAGVLPDGSLDQFGAVPAASGQGRAIVGNQVSSDGSRVFFVSPDPTSCGGRNDCAIDPPELYVREDGEKTLLVSRNALLSGFGGLPASAPSGVFPMVNSATSYLGRQNSVNSYVFASSDGSQAFFQSEDKLAGGAPEGPPGNLSPKTYDFNVHTDLLTYLPNVVGQLVASTTDGSALAFVNSSVSPKELELWSAGADGGTVTPITKLPAEGLSPARVSSARVASDGSVVFETGSRLPLGFNSGGFRQVYRYQPTTNTLGCISCPPAGRAATGNAELSTLQANEGAQGSLTGLTGLVDERGVSADGSRIFFDTPDPLVPQDTDGVRDVYEWENGAVYLISSGKSVSDSFFLDNSESGGDAFFATVDGLSSGDTDGAYDVYDARVPHPGDSPPASAVPCQGSVCQGPPRVPAPLGAPASATFSGLGNIAPEPAPTPAAPKKTTKKTVKCKKGFVKKKNKCVKKPKPEKAKKTDRRAK
jgi:hypothetical protein